MNNPTCPDLRTLGRYRVFNEVEDRRAHATDCSWDLMALASSRRLRARALQKLSTDGMGRPQAVPGRSLIVAM